MIVVRQPSGETDDALLEVFIDRHLGCRNPLLDDHAHHYNFARPHASLKDPYPRTPAMAAGVADHVWSLEEIAGLLG